MLGKTLPPLEKPAKTGLNQTHKFRQITGLYNQQFEKIRQHIGRAVHAIINDLEFTATQSAWGL